MLFRSTEKTYVVSTHTDTFFILIGKGRFVLDYGMKVDVEND